MKLLQLVAGLLRLNQGSEKVRITKLVVFTIVVFTVAHFLSSCACESLTLKGGKLLYDPTNPPAFFKP